MNSYIGSQRASSESDPFPWVFEPGALPKLLVLAFLAVLVISLWWHFRPCESCGEYRDQCRCKPRDY